MKRWRALNCVLDHGCHICVVAFFCCAQRAFFHRKKLRSCLKEASKDACEACASRHAIRPRLATSTWHFLLQSLVRCHRKKARIALASVWCGEGENVLEVQRRRRDQSS